MRTQPFRRLSRSDFPEAPEWVDRLFQNLNLSLEDVANALDHSLTDEDNSSAIVFRDVEIFTDTEFELSVEDLSPPTVDVRLRFAYRSDDPSWYDYARVAWVPLDDDNVRVKVKFDDAGSVLTSTTKIFATLIVEGS